MSFVTQHLVSLQVRNFATTLCLLFTSLIWFYWDSSLLWGRYLVPVQYTRPHAQASGTGRLHKNSFSLILTNLKRTSRGALEKMLPVPFLPGTSYVAKSAMLWLEKYREVIQGFMESHPKLRNVLRGYL